eukprot:4776224-Prymnesium_polylepis.1
MMVTAHDHHRSHGDSNSVAEHRGPKWRSALRCAAWSPAPTRPTHAPASRMPNSAAHPSVTQAIS